MGACCDARPGLNRSETSDVPCDLSLKSLSEMGCDGGEGRPTRSTDPTSAMYLM